MIDLAPRHAAFERETVIPSKLGYAGIVLQNRGVDGLPDVIAVYDGNLEIRYEGKVSFRQDPEKVIEQWLLQAAVERMALDEREMRFIREGR